MIKIEERSGNRTPGPLPRSLASAAGPGDLPLPLYFAMTPASRKDPGGRGFWGWGVGGGGVVTPTGIGVSMFLPGANPSHLLCNLN